MKPGPERWICSLVSPEGASLLVQLGGQSGMVAKLHLASRDSALLNPTAFDIACDYTKELPIYMIAVGTPKGFQGPRGSPRGYHLFLNGKHLLQVAKDSRAPSVLAKKVH